MVNIIQLLKNVLGSWLCLWGGGGGCHRIVGQCGIVLVMCWAMLVPYSGPFNTLDPAPDTLNPKTIKPFCAPPPPPPPPCQSPEALKRQTP